MPSTPERDGPSKWLEPFAAMFWRIRVQSYLLVLALVGLVVQGFWLYRLGTRASAHVYEVHPDGKATYIGDRDANLAPRPMEARYVARRFVELLYGWNSSTVHQDLAEVVSMCAPAMAGQFRKELADAQFVDQIRRRAIRSEVAFEHLEVLDHTHRQSRVAVAGRVNIFPIDKYEGGPVDSKPFSVQVILAAVPRDPDLRPNGLEVVRLVKQDVPSEEAKP